MQLSSPENVCKKHMNSMTNQFKMRAQSRPKRAQGVQNEPRRVPEGSRKPPKVTKKLPGGAGIDLVMFYNSKLEPKGILEAARASKISQEASQKHPKGV